MAVAVTACGVSPAVLVDKSGVEWCFAANERGEVKDEGVNVARAEDLVGMLGGGRVGVQSLTADTGDISDLPSQPEYSDGLSSSKALSRRTSRAGRWL